ncbi:MAG: pyrroline-5-carboxylate reductase [Clostridia bacterium]|nr:pyrroline-5-carboxylate reductase [Clostridia bacterium]
MEKKFKLGVIGGGFMSYSIVSGALSAKFLSANEILVSDVNESSLVKFSDKGVNVTLSNFEVLNQSEFVLFAVKPQNFIGSIGEIENISCKKFISIMAGVKKSTIKSALKIADVKVARCMPNTPCSVGSGAVGIDLSDYETAADRGFIENLFSSFAKVIFVEESKLNAVTGISGSSPAYFYLFIKCLVDAGVKQGLSYEDAKKLAANTMIGSGKMIFENADKSLDELITAVCSKGGTTIEAIKVFNECNLAEITDKAVAACVKRAEELENLS